ncbi:MAG TPA: D-alanyl-D-alanine carboxypeptidase [Dermatophilaceae bacterium]|nr:D-alanyl-D-alanine carboxypeptidase [Dermatophilaceae bacterium]
MRRAVAVPLALVLLGTTGYAVADVLDVAPGILTRDGPPQPTPTPGGTASPTWLALPTPTAPASAPAPSRSATATGPAPGAPSASGLAAALAGPLADPALGSVGISVRDAVTGAEIWSRSADRPRTPASTAKLLSALAVTRTLDPADAMTTSVVAGSRAGEVVLVAGGDTLLASGGGRPGVAGRAGLADLAEQVATRLTAQGVGAVTLRLDLGYAAGPPVPDTWKPADVGAGFARAVTMLALADSRPEPGRPSPADPAAEVGRRLAALLTERGHRTTLAPASSWATPAPSGAAVLGTVGSAPYGDVLALALDDSDNALTENLVRQAMAARGVPTARQGGSADFVTAEVRAAGVVTTGMVLKDASGLSPGQRVSARTLSSVLGLAAAGTPPGLRGAVAALPVAGLTGTLADRFDEVGTRAVAGIPRAKSGTLTGASGLAGTTVDADGHPLTFVVLADDLPPARGTLEARAALDRVAAALTRCGCR